MFHLIKVHESCQVYIHWVHLDVLLLVVVHHEERSVLSASERDNILCIDLKLYNEMFVALLN